MPTALQRLVCVKMRRGSPCWHEWRVTGTHADRKQVAHGPSPGLWPAFSNEAQGACAPGQQLRSWVSTHTHDLVRLVQGRSVRTIAAESGSNPTVHRGNGRMCGAEGPLSHDTAMKIKDCCIYSVPPMTTAVSSVEKTRPLMTDCGTVYQAPEGRRA